MCCRWAASCIASSWHFQGFMQNVVSLIGQQDSKCGYCKTSKSKSFGIWAHTLSPSVLYALMNRGWRRCGLYIYRPYNNCCKLQSIRLKCSEFELSSKQRRILAKFKHLNVEIKLERASVTKNSFDLYKKYQNVIHNDQDVSEEGFKRFLVDSCLPSVGDYGTFHRKYFDGSKLIAVEVLDILPQCTSSVYFIYDPKYKKYSLGKVSALIEIEFAQQRNAYYYLGYYIADCTKMSYKADYQPSELLDQVTYEWKRFGDLSINSIPSLKNSGEIPESLKCNSQPTEQDFDLLVEFKDLVGIDLYTEFYYFFI